MKCSHILLCCLLPLLCACGPRRYPSSLLMADSLASVRPDSALTLLQALAKDTTDMSQAARMYYRLLCVKAADKAYLPHTSDSLIRPVLHYYIEKGDKRLLSEAYYYAGRVYRDLGDAPQALDYFEQSLEAMRKQENLKVKSKVYAQMGTLFLYQDMYPEALQAFRGSFQCDVALKDTVGVIFNYRDMANCYRSLEQPDSALWYFEQAGILCRKIRRMDRFRDVQSQLARLYLDLGEYDSAHDALQVALQEIEEPNRSGIYTIAARYYYETGRMDSVAWYCNRLLEWGNVYSKQSAFRYLLEMALQRRDALAAEHYYTGYCQYADSVQQLTQTETVRLAHAYYNYQYREREIAHLQAETERRNWLIAVTSGGLVLLVLLFLLYWQYNKRRTCMLEIRMQRVNQLLNEGEQEVRKARQRIKLLETRLNDSHQELERKAFVEKELQLAKEQYAILVDRMKADKKWREQVALALTDTSIVKSLHKKAKSPVGVATVTADEWQDLKEQVLHYYPEFFEKLDRLYLPFKADDVKLNMLLKAGFKPSDIAVLLRRPVQTITTMRRRLAEKLSLSEKITPAHWDEFIASL